jgi:hypothetical protein
MKSAFQKRCLAIAMGGLFLVSTAFTTGCQVSVGGQTLPSSYYMQDDIQYYPKGPKFKLYREAAAIKAARAGDRTQE